MKTKQAKEQCTYERSINLAYRLYMLVFGDISFTEFETKYIYDYDKMQEAIRNKEFEIRA